MWEDQRDQWVAAGFSAFWYLGYHALFWLDLYLTGAEEGFAPPEPFDLVEMEAGESLPRTYTREELLRYREYCRRKCQETIVALSSRTGFADVQIQLGRAAVCGAAALQPPSCARAWGTTAHVPGTAGRKSHKVGCEGLAKPWWLSAFSKRAANKA